METAEDIKKNYYVNEDKTYYEELICPSCNFVMETDLDKDNFITYGGKTTSEWDDLKCPNCGQELEIDIVSAVVFCARKKMCLDDGTRIGPFKTPEELFKELEI